MPLPFGTPCYFGNVRGNLIYCSVLSSGWQESPQGNTKVGIRGEGLGEWRVWKRALSPLHPPWWICKTDPWCLIEEKLWHGPLFRCTDLWMPVIITYDTMKSIPSPVTSKCYRIFMCHNRKIKSQVKWTHLWLYVYTVQYKNLFNIHSWMKNI